MPTLAGLKALRDKTSSCDGNTCNNQELCEACAKLTKHGTSILDLAISLLEERAMVKAAVKDIKTLFFGRTLSAAPINSLLTLLEDKEK